MIDYTNMTKKETSSQLAFLKTSKEKSRKLKNSKRDDSDLW